MHRSPKNRAASTFWAALLMLGDASSVVDVVLLEVQPLGHQCLEPFEVELAFIPNENDLQLIDLYSHFLRDSLHQDWNHVSEVHCCCGRN